MMLIVLVGTRVGEQHWPRIINITKWKLMLHIIRCFLLISCHITFIFNYLLNVAHTNTHTDEVNVKCYNKAPASANHQPSLV